MKAKIEIKAWSISVEIPWILAAQLEHALYARNIPAGVSYNVGDATRKYSFDRRKYGVKEIRVILTKANIPSVSAKEKAEEERARNILIANTSLRKGMAGFAMKANQLQTLGDLADKTEAELVRMLGVGGKTLNAVREVLKEHHLSLKD